MQKALVHRVAQGKEEIQAGADVQRDRGGEAGAEHAKLGRAQVAEYQHPVQENIDRMHDQQGAQVHAGHVDGTPVPAEGKVHAHRDHAGDTDLEVGRAEFLHLRVVGQESECPGRHRDQHQAQRDTDEQGQHQAAIQRNGRFRFSAFAQPARGQRLHAGGQADDEGNREVTAEAADPGGRQRGITEAADHADIDQVEYVLRHHPAHDGQGDAPDHLAPFPVREEVFQCLPGCFHPVSRQKSWFRESRRSGYPASVLRSAAG